MFNQRIIWLLILIGQYAAYVQAQISMGGLPESFKLESNVIGLREGKSYHKVHSPDMKKVMKKDANFSWERLSVPIKLDLNLKNSGRWQALPNGDRLWQLHIEAKDAKFLILIYDQFYIPEGAKLFMYSPEHKQILGAYTHINNKASGKFLTGEIYGDKAILEYYEPESQIGNGIIKISRLEYGYKQLYSTTEPHKIRKDFPNVSGECHKNINCEIGADWQNPKRGVVRIMTVSNEGCGWCSGSLINNTAFDSKAYILSAFHCQEKGQVDFDLWRFDFQYEMPDCESDNLYPQSQSIVGAVKRAKRGRSDFLLLELTTHIPNTYQPYFNGWNRIDNPRISDGAVSIHHPQGDVKKISVERDRIFTTKYSKRFPRRNEHYYHISNWNQGTTEGGSSGAPLFNTRGQIVGQLRGGGSACSGNSDNGASDWFGKFSSSWDGGNGPDERLREWLDPNNLGWKAIDGLDNYCRPEANIVLPISLPGTYNAQNKIIASNKITIEWNDATHFTAGKSISLKPGFEVIMDEFLPPTAFFSSKIAQCEPMIPVESSLIEKEYEDFQVDNFTLMDEKDLTDRTALKVYPNPITSSTIISFFMIKESMMKIQLQSIDGRILKEFNISSESGYNEFVLTDDILNYPSGIYILKLLGGNLNENQKILIP